MRPARGIVLAPVFLALLLLAQPALASGTLAEVQAVRLSAQQAATTGALGAFATVSGDGEALLSAAWVRAVYEQESRETIGNNSVRPPGEKELDPVPPEQDTYANVANGTADLRDRHEAYVLPLPGAQPPLVRPAAGCAALRPSVDREVHPTAKVGTAQARHREAADVSRTAAWDAGACAASAWTVEGDFLLTLWDADVRLPNDHGTAAYRTGPEYPPDFVTQPVGVTLGGTRANRQLYLEVHGGRLELRVSGPSVYFARAEVEAATVRLDGAIGTAGGQPLSDALLELEGRLTAGVRPQGGAFSVTVRGRLEGGSADGASFTVAQAGGGPTPWLWSALLAVPVLAGAMWRRRPEAVLARLGGGLLAGRRDAAARAARLRAPPDLATEATAVRVEALARAGWTEAALAVAGALPAAQRGLAAALAHGLAGDVAAGVRALEAFPADPALARLALLDPTLAAAWPALRRWLDAEGSR